MLRIIMLLFVFNGGYLTVFQAKAAEGCRFEGGDPTLGVPQMEIAANTPDGTVLYISPKITKRLICPTYSGTPVLTNVPILGQVTNEYKQLSTQLNGVKFNIHIDGYSFDDKAGSLYIGRTSSHNGVEEYNKDVTLWFDVSVDSSRGKIPISGTVLSGTYKSLQITLGTSTNISMAFINLKTPQITYIPCAMKLSISPDTIDFGLIKNSELAKGVKLQRKFSTSIQKSAGCSAYGAVPFHINMYFEPTNSVINADGSLSLNNGLGLTISDASGKDINYNTIWKINDVTGDLGVKNYFTANLHKVSGQDIKTGPFSADVVVRLSYY